MKIAKVFIYFITFILIHSCATSKAVEYLKEGKTVEENFKVTLPFEIKNGYIIVEVKNKKQEL